jgi:hypothetical protein
MKKEFIMRPSFWHPPKDEALDLILNVLQAVETWVGTLQQENEQLAQPSLRSAPLCCRPQLTCSGSFSATLC